MLFGTYFSPPIAVIPVSLASFIYFLTTELILIFLDTNNVGLLYLPDIGDITKASANSSPEATKASLLSLNLDLAIATE